ncbi:anti-sigma factor [Blastococcus goldschmidtiae]|uniref:Regulator of SigK n=1 Tax=Blastococcus goldschmidtiae TaxID=3075546 RepID=A0ABU2K5B9_9ACTN|nr:anti-sigma factor [Blastococcus sp. DSM 46792]MDT0275381.1 anti-sigma factor [Blastococcus sp. DSM 46792]
MSVPRPGPGHDEAFEELAVGWALHALEPEDAEVFLIHLDRCPYCRQIADETTEVMAAMAGAAPAAEPPPSLGERLRAEVARTPQETPFDGAGAPAGVPARPAEPAPAAPVAVPAQRRRWTAVLVAAALAAVVGLGGWTVALLDDRNDAQRTADAQTALVEQLLQPGPATVVPVEDREDRTVATLLARDDGVQLISHGLQTNDRDAEIYVLWGLDQGTPKPLGEFDVTEDGLQLETLEVEGADDFPRYGISIERGRTAPEAPTDVVAEGALPS